MKRYLRLLPALFFALLPAFAFCTPLSGTYTIGGSSPNYNTFTAAVNDLNTLGVSGPVTFNVRAGTYNESITINTVSGASSTNTVTFQAENGVASSVTITYQYNTVVLNASHYIIFNNMTIEATVELYETTKAFVIQGNSTYCSITNCILNCPIAPWTDYTFVIYASSGTNDNILVSGCHINGGGFGYEIEGGGTNYGPCLVNNVWNNQTYMAIDLMGVNNALIQGNTITSTCVTTPQYSGPVTGSRFGIILWNGTNNVQILENKIYNDIQFGMYVPTLGGGNNVLIANNFIQAQYGIYGIYTYNYSILNNSFNTTSYGIYMYDCSGNIVKNNIFYNTGGTNIFNLDTSYCLAESDYNAFYTTGAFATTTTSSTNFQTLAKWQTVTGMDVHSRTVIPSYVSDTDLHLTNYAPLRFGIPLANVPIDIDFALRGANPTVGAADTGTVFSYPNLSACCGCVEAAFSANPTVVCQGDSVKFTDQSGGSATAWNWTFNGGTPHQSNSHNPQVVYDTAGTYDVTLKVTISGQPYTITKTGYITVNGLPQPGVISASPDSVCSGSSAQVAVTSDTGTIQWQTSNDGIAFTNIPSANAASYTTPVLTQNTYYRVEVTGQCGTDSSAAAMVHVIALPTTGSITPVPDSVCEGSSSRLTIAGSKGTIQWQMAGMDGNYSNIGADTTIYNTSALSQTATYRVVVNNGMCSDTSSAVSVAVRPSPIAPTLNTKDSVICASDSARINSSGSYASYKWNDGDTTSYTYARAAGDSWVTVTDANGCTAVSGELAISVYPVPSVSIVLLGDTLSSFNSPFYQWFYNDSIIPGANSPVYVAQRTGEYAVEVMDSNGCKEISNYTMVTVSGLNEPVASRVNIYPDPFTNTIFINVNNGVNLEDIRVYNVLGEEVLAKNLNGSNLTNLSLDVKALPVGAYYLHIKTGSGELVKKMIKE